MSDFKIVSDMSSSTFTSRNPTPPPTDTIELNPSTSTFSSSPRQVSNLPTSTPSSIVDDSLTSSGEGGARKRKKGFRGAHKKLAKGGVIVGKNIGKAGMAVGQGFKKTGGALGSVWDDFGNFLRQGAVVDLAVGIVLGGAFTLLINSIVNDLVAPIIGLAIDANLINAFIVLRCGKNATNPDCKVGSQSGYGTVALANADGAVTFNWGSFIQVCINVLMISFVVFFLVKVYAATFLRKHGGGKRKPCPRCDEEVSANAHVCKWCSHEFDDSTIPDAPPRHMSLAVLTSLPGAFKKPRRKPSQVGETTSPELMTGDELEVLEEVKEKPKGMTI
ncbi:large-conductance mechanosensitive channel [Chytridium lagenaria]|nr:large-conductance mechanosensitive channel [Chytridium lagenaria]